MKLSLLLQREPFGAILERTLSDFWSRRDGVSFEVRWFASNPGARFLKQQGFQPWFGNEKLNFLASRKLASTSLNSIRSCYGNNPVWWKRPLTKAYVFVYTAKPVWTHFSRVVLGVRPEVRDANDCLILGGNNRIRLLQPRSKKCTVLLKAGFDSKYFRNEIQLRQSFPCLAAPALNEVSLEHGWYEEEFVGGLGVDRLLGSTKQIYIQMAHRTLLNGLIVPSLEWESSEYVFQALLERASRFLRLIRARVPEIVGRTEHILNVFKAGWQAHLSRQSRVPTALSHGDFQAGNFLVQDAQLWLTDWEYCGRRCAFYDPLTFMLRTRFPRKLSVRLTHFLEQTAFPESFIESWPGLGTNGLSRLEVLILFLLEELVFRLEECDNTQFTLPNPGSIEFLGEVQGFLNQLGWQL